MARDWLPNFCSYVLLATILCLLGAGVWGAPRAGAQAIAFDSVQTDTYVLYAPTEQALRNAQPQLDAAVERFRGTFGVTPPRISVLLVDDPATLQSMDLTPYRDGGEAFLPYITPEEGTQRLSASASAVFVLGGDAIVVEQGETVRVAGTVPIASTSTPLQQGDEIETLQGRPVDALADVRRRYRAIAVDDSVQIRVRRSGTTSPTTITFQKREREGKLQVEALPDLSAGDDAERSAHSEPPLERTLAHEAGHAFLEAYGNVRLEHRGRSSSTEDAAGDDAAGTYGHPRLPDWLDEAAATLSEEPPSRRSRLQALRNRFDERIPLSELFSMQHPFAGLNFAEGDTTASDDGGPSVMMMRMETGGDLADRLILFYAQSLSVGEFLRERAGADGFRRVVDALLNGASTVEAFRQVDGLPVTISIFEEEWTEWVRK